MLLYYLVLLLYRKSAVYAAQTVQMFKIWLDLFLFSLSYLFAEICEVWAEMQSMARKWTLSPINQNKVNTDLFFRHTITDRLYSK